MGGQKNFWLAPLAKLSPHFQNRGAALDSFGCRIIRYVCDRLTDGRTKATLIAPFPTGEHNNVSSVYFVHTQENTRDYQIEIVAFCPVALCAGP